MSSNSLIKTIAKLINNPDKRDFEGFSAKSLLSAKVSLKKLDSKIEPGIELEVFKKTRRAFPWRATARKTKKGKWKVIEGNANGYPEGKKFDTLKDFLVDFVESD